MRMKKNIFFRVFSALFAVCIVANVVLLNGHTVSAQKMNRFVKTCEDSIVPYIDETTLYFRTYNGQKQMRLWSNNEGKWLTDWITIP